MQKFTEKEIQEGLNKAYKEAGHNVYFGNGFNAGIEFARQRQADLLKALSDLLGVHLQIVNCAFCGNTEIEKKEEILQAKEAIKKATT